MTIDNLPDGIRCENAKCAGDGIVEWELYDIDGNQVGIAESWQDDERSGVLAGSTVTIWPKPLDGESYISVYTNIFFGHIDQRTLNTNEYGSSVLAEKYMEELHEEMLWINSRITSMLKKCGYVRKEKSLKRSQMWQLLRTNPALACEMLGISHEWTKEVSHES